MFRLWHFRRNFGLKCKELLNNKFYQLYSENVLPVGYECSLVPDHRNKGQRNLSICIRQNLVLYEPLTSFHIINKANLSSSCIKELTCWKCNTKLKRTDLFCTSCTVLQEPSESLTYFDVLQQPRDFDLNVEALTKKFRELQWQLHPDKFGTRSEKEQQLSSQYSSLVNKAYQTLSKPLDRGLYLLELNGKAIDEEIQVDNELLMHVMEINEEISEPVSTNRMKEIKLENDRVMEETMKKASEAFKDNRLDDARQYLAKLKYFVNIDTKLANLMEKNG